MGESEGEEDEEEAGEDEEGLLQPRDAVKPGDKEEEEEGWWRRFGTLPQPAAPMVVEAV